jgi:hypothetical protein
MQTDPLSLLLTKHIPPEQRPPRDVTGDWQRADVHTLVVYCIMDVLHQRLNMQK